MNALRQPRQNNSIRKLEICPLVDGSTQTGASQDCRLGTSLSHAPGMMIVQPAQDQLAAASTYFAKNGYVVLRNALASAEAALCADYALMQASDPEYFREEAAFTARGRYADVLTESLLVRMQPLMERAVGAVLFPCYSYLRIYHHGAELPQHTDRPSCEISTSITLGYRGATTWPLRIGTRDGVLAIDLRPGDMLAYLGAELPHWRERFDGELWIQAFLHYVRADGPHAHFRFDGRERVGAFDPRRHRRRFDVAQPQVPRNDAG